jgi:hypothetical protein
MSDIRIKVIVDGQESIQTIDELNKSLDSFKKNTSDLGDGSKEVDDFNKSIEDLQKTLDGGLSIDPSKINQTLDSVSAELTNLTGQSFDIKVDVPETTFKSIDELQTKLEDGLNLNTDEFNTKVGNVENELTNLTDKSFDIKVDVPDSSVKSIGALKKEYQELLNELESTDPQSSKFNELQSRLKDVGVQAAQARDKIEDFNDGVKIRSGSPIEQFRNSLALTKEGILNLEFGKVKEGITGFGAAAKGVIGPLNGLRGAIIATGVGALVVGISLLIANFDKLKEAIEGISGVDRANLDIAKDRTKLEQDKLDSISTQENSLRLQGKSEKDILQIKIAQTNEVITALESQVEAQRVITQQQIETAQRNRDILNGILNFLTTPIKILLDTVDRIVKVFDEDAPSAVEAFNDLIDAGLDQVSLFSPEATAAEGEATQKELAKQLDGLKSQRDGFQLSVIKGEKAATEEVLRDQKKYREELEKLNEKYFSTQEQLITEKYQKELDAIKGNTQAEKELRDAIIATRDAELDDIKNNKVDKEKQTSLDILKLRAETNEELIRLELEQVDLETEIKLRGFKGTEDEKTLILLQAEEQRKSITQKSIDEEIKSIDKQVEDIKSKRDSIFQNIGAGIGVLGSLDELKKTFDEELKLSEQQRQTLKSVNDKILADENSTDEQRKKAEEDNLKIDEEFDKKKTDILEQGAEVRSKIIQDEIALRTQQIGELISIVNSVGQTQIESERSALEVQSNELDTYYEREKQRIEENIKDEDERAKALQNLDRTVGNSKLELEKKNVELQKREIKRERNATLATVGLAAAQTIAYAVAAVSKTDPISFALTLAGNLVAAYAAIKKAKDALKQADSAVSAAGAGGGGGSSLPTPTGGGGGGGGTAQSFVPTGFGPAGINPAGGQNNNNNNGVPPPTQQFVSVVEIERVRNSVITTETNNTIG